MSDQKWLEMPYRQAGRESDFFDKHYAETEKRLYLERLNDFNGYTREIFSEAPEYELKELVSHILANDAIGVGTQIIRMAHYCKPGPEEVIDAIFEEHV